MIMLTRARTTVLMVTAITTTSLLFAAILPAAGAAATAFSQILELSPLDINFPLDLTTLPIVVYDIKMALPDPAQSVDITGEVPDLSISTPVPLPEIEIFLKIDAVRGE
jgi:hypothetical protein